MQGLIEKEDVNLMDAVVSNKWLPRIPKVKAHVCCSMLRKAISISLLTRYDRPLLLLVDL